MMRSIVVAASLALGVPAWAAAPGVTPTEIVIGHDVDLSGAIAVRMKTLVQAAAKENNLEVLGVAAFKEDGSDIAQAIKSVAKANAPAVLLLTLAGPAPKVVEEYLRQASIRPQFFALSIVASDSLYKSIGEKSRGVIVTQIVPFPWDRNIPLVREYQDTVRSKGVTDFSPTGMEGYILAKSLVEGLQAAGKNPTREGLVQAFEQMREKDLGGMKLNFSPTSHNGSRLVEITMIGREGWLVR